MLTITSEQALALAPDASAAQAGRKLATPKQWSNLGYNTQGLWGECRGSALYQVRVDLASLSVKCSCPSRKFPCKHGIGLLLLASAAPDALAEGDPPEWMASWLAKRATAAEASRTQEQASTAPTQRVKSPDTAAVAKRAEKRERLVSDGLDTLDLWLNDLMRNGLGHVEAQPASFWYGQATRLVDAQAPGLAGRLRTMAGIVSAGSQWPQRLLDALGQLALLSQAYRAQDTLDPALRADVRQLLGWNLSAADVEAWDDHVNDRWLTLGQWIADDDRMRTQRTWLLGEHSGRLALILQFSVGGRRFDETFLPGARFEAVLHFWPSAYRLRARIGSRADDAAAMASALDRAQGHDSIEAFLAAFAGALGCQPWLDRLGCALRGVTPIPMPEGAWLVSDGAGVALPLAGDDHWRLLALSGGKPIDLLGEWDGERLLPLGVFADGAYAPLWEVGT
jgi:hypothetical protein